MKLRHKYSLRKQWKFKKSFREPREEAPGTKRLVIRGVDRLSDELGKNRKTKVQVTESREIS